jgi:hypothetical protein
VPKRSALLPSGVETATFEQHEEEQMSGEVDSGPGGHDGMGSEHEAGLAQDSRAADAAESWTRRFGREGHLGSHAVDEDYRRFRERHLAECDRDYHDWCRENEQRFHAHFEDWRSSRRQQAPVAGIEPAVVLTNDPGDSSTLAEDRASDSLVRDEDLAAPAASRRR